MTELIRVERKSAVLTTSSLACLARVPTVNLTAGCAHGCCYCYAQGYLTHPGHGKVRFYTNTLTRLRDELERKRRRPRLVQSGPPDMVYFSPSSDPFQPIPDVLEMTFNVFRFLFEAGIGVAFVTKGLIPDRHRRLLAEHATLVQGRIGITTLDPTITTALEPGAASPTERLGQAAELIACGVEIEARLDPILPAVTDDDDTLDSLCAALARIGVRRIAASVLFLRPAIVAALRRRVGDRRMLENLLSRFSKTERLAIHAARSRVSALPAVERAALMDRLKQIATGHALEVLVCACKNPDIPSSPCHISGRWVRGEDKGQQQLSLFPDVPP